MLGKGSDALPDEIQIKIISQVSPKNALRLVNKDMKAKVHASTESLRWLFRISFGPSARLLSKYAAVLDHDKLLRAPPYLPLCPTLVVLDMHNAWKLNALPQNLPLSLRSIKISFTSVHDLGPITACTGLQSFTYEHAALVKSWKPLASCLDLRTLHISHPRGIDAQTAHLSLLTTCTRLEQARLYNIPPMNIALLSACTNLHTLDISCSSSFNSSSVDLSCLTHLKSIASLNVDGHNIANLPDIIQQFCQLTSLTTSSLSHLPVTLPTTLQHLRHLDISSTEIQDISPLARCSTLTSLKCTHAHSFEDASALSACAALQVLDLSFCHHRQIPEVTSLTSLDLQALCLDSLRELARCSLLQTLLMAHCQVHDEDFSPLSACASLTSLDLACTSFSDMAVLHSCKDALRFLRLRSTNVKGWTPLSTFTALTSLDVAATNICDVTPLTTCTSLATLVLRSCHQVTDLSPLSGHPTLQRLDLVDTHVLDLSPLVSCKGLGEVGVDSRRMVHGCVELRLSGVEVGIGTFMAAKYDYT